MFRLDNKTNGEFNQVGVVGILPENGAFVHGNVFNVTNMNSSRYILLEEKRNGVYAYYNTVNLTDCFDGVSNTGNRMFRARFGAYNCVLGYNTINGFGSTIVDDPQSVLYEIYGQETAGLADIVGVNLDVTAATRTYTTADAVDFTSILSIGDLASFPGLLAGNQGSFTVEAVSAQSITVLDPFLTMSDQVGGVSDVQRTGRGSAFDMVCHDGSANGVARGALNCQEIAQNIYSFGNATSNCNRGLFLRSLAATSMMSNMWSVSDVFAGSVDDVFMQAPNNSTPAVNNVNFVNFVPNITKQNGGSTVKNVNYFEQGDSGLTNMSPDNYDLSRVPSAPTV